MASKKTVNRKLVIAILDRGWIFVGRAEITDKNGGFLLLSNASCIRYWGTSRGIGELALEGPKSGTKLDPAGSLAVPTSSVIAMIDAVESAWPNQQ